MHSISKELFNKFNARSGSVLLLDDVIDERIKPLCQAIHEYPHATPVWSCSGHTYDENNAKYLEAKATTGDTNLRIRSASKRWYLTFVTTDQCEGIIERISGVIHNLPRELRLQFDPSLQMKTLGNFFTDDGSFYKTWVLDGMFRDNPNHIHELSKLWADIITSLKDGNV